MNPGQLDRRLTLLTRTVATDAAGAPVDTWLENGFVWAQRLPAVGGESVLSGANRSTVAASYRVRYRADLAAADATGKIRIRTDGRDYDLLSALEDDKQPRRAFMILALAYTQGEPTLTAIPALP